MPLNAGVDAAFRQVFFWEQWVRFASQQSHDGMVPDYDTFDSEIIRAEFAVDLSARGSASQAVAVRRTAARKSAHAWEMQPFQSLPIRSR